MSVRVFASGPFEPGAVVELDPEEAHYVLRVRRRKVGDEVDVLDGEGGYARASVVSTGKKRVEIRIDSIPPPQRPPTLRLACGLLDPKAMLEVVTHATEFGAAELILLRCERTTFDPPGTRRMAAAIRAAQRQSGRAAALIVRGPLTVDALIRERAPDERWVLADPSAEPPRGPFEATSLLLVGPEGGFTAQERESLARAGASPLGLSDHVLRAPTACLSGLSVLQALGRRPSQT